MSKVADGGTVFRSAKISLGGRCGVKGLIIIFVGGRIHYGLMQIYTTAHVTFRNLPNAIG